MDKNTVIGLVLIVAIIVGYNWFTRPTEEQRAAMQHRRDSLALVEQQNKLLEAELEAEAERMSEQLANEQTRQLAEYGDFAAVAEGEEQFTTVENEVLRLTFSNKGGRIYAAELKNYTTWDSLPLILFTGDDNKIDFTLRTANNRVINTSNLYFTTLQPDSQTVVMRLAMNDSSYLDFTYAMVPNDYMVQFDVQAHNMGDYLAPQMNSLDIDWSQNISQKEKGRKFESRYATLNYRYLDDDMEQMSEAKNDHEETSGKVEWIAYKDQFFSTIFIARDNAFQSPTLDSKVEDKLVGYLKHYDASTSVDFDVKGDRPTHFSIYMGPNQYKILCGYNDLAENSEAKLHLEKVIPLGWAIFRWVSEWIVIPLFNFLNRYISNFGIIILLMTIVIKLIILPFTYKSYMSTAKMRVLKPQIDAINAKIPAEKAMERQQATMALYQKVGVSPMSGCLPMLLQMPILFAMFAFFPTAIELRQQSFLWANDLSCYDAIVSWDTYIPFITPYFGNHISLFCLLMTITNVIYTYVNMQSQAGADQMKMMKWMMYLMPLMFLFIFNDYASGLSYYYFISLLFTIIQTYIFRLCIDEKKLLAKLEARKSKPTKKSGFMARLEEAARQQQKLAQEQAKKGRR